MSSFIRIYATHLLNCLSKALPRLYTYGTSISIATSRQLPELESALNTKLATLARPCPASGHRATAIYAKYILIPLEQLHTSRDSIRKAREAFLIHGGKTLEPAGLNRRDEM